MFKVLIEGCYYIDERQEDGSYKQVFFSPRGVGMAKTIKKAKAEAHRAMRGDLNRKNTSGQGEGCALLVETIHDIKKNTTEEVF